MAVFHILKDGRRVDDISGYIVSVKDAEPLYRLIRDINRGRKNESSSRQYAEKS